MAIAFERNRISQAVQQFQQFVETAVHIANDVERPVLEICDCSKAAAVRSSQHRPRPARIVEDIEDAFAFQSTQAAPELLALIAHNMRTELAVWPGRVAFVAQLLWKIKDDSDREDVIFACEGDQ